MVVLKGATETLKKVTFVQLEVSLKLLFYTQHYEIIIREKEYKLIVPKTSGKRHTIQQRWGMLS